MRVAVVGAGYFARFQIGAWRRLVGDGLVAVADLDPARRAWVAGAHPGVSALADGAEAIALEPDILDIATPPATHAALVRAALGHVGAIICQKPFCSDLGEARAVTAEARVAGTRLIVHENFRFQPWYRKARSLIGDGTIGRVRQARFALRPGDGRGPGAYLDRQPYFRQMPRFLIRETGIHFIDTFRYLFGEPVAVYADLRRENDGIAGEDAGFFVFDTADGGRAVFDGNRTLDHAARNRRLTMGEMEIEGTEASLRLSGDGGLSLRGFGSDDWSAVDFGFSDREFGGDCVHAFQAHALDALRSGADAETEAADYLRNLELEALVYRAAAEGRKLSAGGAP